MANFREFNFKEYIYQALDEINFKEPTEVQARLIPTILKGKSVVGQSQTGSGKTHTFLLPIFQNLNAQKDEVQAVITTPSRELAYQIYEAAKQLAKFSPENIWIQNYVGGTDKQRQIEKLKSHQPQLVIGTPGRILDLVRENALDIHNAHYLVVDEADMTLDLGFLKETDAIASTLPKDLQMLVFSATIPEKLRPFLRKYMYNPVIEVVANKHVISPTIDNWLVSTKGRDRNKLIYDLLTMGEPYLALVFANTKERADELTNYLRSQGLKVAKVHGGIQPRQRKRIMREIQNLDYQFVVATDLAARGIDIEGVSHVINDDIPEDLEFFVHRVGRTGRNGMKGTAITLYEPSEEKLIDELESMGVHFVPKAVKNGEIVDSYDRNRREKRQTRKESMDPKLRGFVKKEKKKRKPGYKKKIKRAIKRDEQQKRRIARRQARKMK
ncbi:MULTISPECIES: DEAD/DEAH box helicase [Ligilactobacillus]|jgi:ATP-dependent RNA helicase CshB|uniref:DEAD-box ATP-dependent RNA helicase CshB n=5 Tax=Ligilactobacillus salivarius TaxID=1624 RepID=A0A1V9R3P8_9LACO|nr:MULTISPECIES: DEAD/DEAH box helicase [Ligilactobacillus]ATP36716.1 ATP-dependent helicase [Ligilactobacillus salivarius]EEJ74403.1 DEAD/DEAH box helicase [Ligilactobacillus salivarius DSM 20555 = ATCC 11741]EGL99841.1 ATP-dependent RNA helicase YqfR [Ligilactobacillus salivarius NIAS840]EGM52456.1 ATP-dependent RNA helicase [Ligilactobacillus salivarius GJ-24]EIA32050.1 ATP-dependent RNA helicase [Ligilactobacillus salivarius SMXD51]